MRAEQPSDRYLAPRVIQGIGILLVVAFAVFWAVTGRESTLFVGVGLSLILLGGYDKAHRELTAALRRNDESSS